MTRVPVPRVSATGRATVAIGGDSYGDVYATYHPEPPRPVRWPVLIGRPPLRADAYQARVDLCEELDRALDSGGTVLITEVLAGDGGTGKSQLAAAAFERARAPLDLAIWVNAASRAQAIVLPPGEVADSADAEERADTFLRWLTTTSRSWVMVLDDLADPQDLQDLWPSGRHGRVLVTTRRRDAAVLARGHVVNVGVFHPRESLAYLTQKLSAVKPPGWPRISDTCRLRSRRLPP